MADDLFKPERYDLPTEEFIEFSPEADGSIKETELKEQSSDAPDILTAPKLEILRYAAKKGMNVDIVDPDQSCGKCYGTGYTSVDSVSRMPNACKCIFPSPTNLRRIEKQKLRKMAKDNRKAV